MKKLTKLKAPKFKGKEFSERVLYFADPYISRFCETSEDEFIKFVYEPSEVLGIRFTNYKCTVENPFYPEHLHYSILFFDYGGMIEEPRKGRISLLDNYSMQFVKIAEEFPSRLYCVVSTFTKPVVRDAMVHLGTVPANIVFTLEDLVKLL